MACDDKTCLHIRVLPVDSGEEKVFILCPGYFLYCHVFSTASALDYSLLKHVVINDNL